ncbi:hypothetical protein [Rubritalea tangerina]|uniref:hypothetical protein n=1 Tax=Rubritalea tangerina TaxID=430798 RepID=UPI00361B9208
MKFRIQYISIANLAVLSLCPSHILLLILMIKMVIKSSRVTDSQFLTNKTLHPTADRG